MRKKLSVFISVSIMALMLVACGATDNSSSPSGDVTDGKNEVSSSISTNADTNVGANTNTTPEPEQVAVDPGIEQTVGEYIASQDKTPKYYVINPIYQCLDELVDYNMLQLLENRVAIVYFGEEMIPSPNDEVLIVPTYFDKSIWEKTLEEVIETINGYYIGEITKTPARFETLSSTYSDPEPPKVLTSLRVGKTLEQCIDLSNYYPVVTGLETTKNYNQSISHALPFVVYDIDSDCKLYNASDKDETWVLHANVLLGKSNSVMIVKMKDVETYDILLRVSKEDLNNCNFYDVASYKVLAVNLTEKEVGKIVLPGGVLNSDYNYLMNYKKISIEEAIGKPLFEYLLNQNKIPEYFIFNPYEEIYEELSMRNKGFLLKNSTVYVYLESYSPSKKDVFIIETSFDESVRDMSLEEVIDVVKGLEIVSIEKNVDNP